MRLYRAIELYARPTSIPTPQRIQGPGRATADLFVQPFQLLHTPIFSLGDCIKDSLARLLATLNSRPVSLLTPTERVQCSPGTLMLTGLHTNAQARFLDGPGHEEICLPLRIEFQHNPYGWNHFPFPNGERRDLRRFKYDNQVFDSGWDAI